MKSILSGFIIYVGFLTSCSEKETSPDIYIAKYPDDKAGAISFTFDDGLPSSYTRIAPLFDRYGYKASFFIIADNIRGDQWFPWVDLSQRGFEIGNHSLTHLNMKDVRDTAIINREVFQSFRIIKNKIGKEPFSFVHPFHTTNALVNAAIFKKHKATRVSPRNFCKWGAWMEEKEVGYIKKMVRETVDDSRWYVGCAHGIGDGWGSLSEKFFVEILDYVKQFEDKLHVDTFENLSKYKIEKDGIEMSLTENVNEKIIELRSWLDESTFDYPLTLVLKDCANFESLKISSLNKEIRTKQVGQNVFIYAPINSAISITWNNSTKN